MKQINNGRKQVNKSQPGSWEGWCAVAGPHCNEGAGLGPLTLT